MTKKRISRAAALILFIAICTGMVWAQDSYWEGKVSTAPYGLLPNSGLYAASNAFPLDSKVEIAHPSNGTTIEVRVVERVNTDRIFMQVSRDAAQKLGISEDEILTAKVSPVQTESDMIESMVSQDKPYTSDPDLNPSAEVEEDGLSVVEQYLADRTQSDRAQSDREQQAPEKAPSPPPVDEITLTTEPIKEPTETAPAEEPTQETGPAPVEKSPSAEAPADEAPKADTLPDTSQPRSQIAVDLPEPSLQPERTAAAEAESGEPASAEDTVDETSAESETGESAGPEVAALEPLFIQEKDRRYSPAAPQLPESGERAEGPTASLASVSPNGETEAGVLENDMRISHSPEPPRAEAPSADIAAAEEPAGEEAAADGLSHAPVLPAEKVAAEKTEREAEPEAEPEVEEIPEDAELVLVPAEERPPEGPPTVTEEPESAAAEPTEEPPAEEPPAEEVRRAASAERAWPAAGDIAVQRSIDSGSYYLQVAAYSRLDLARSRGQELAAQYPVTLYREGGSTTAPYKLMIGPLNEHESGTLLFTFTARGYRDAFIRKGN